ncbi:iron-containing alcohol dehydrogenase [Devosia sp. CAU 1758]
MALIQYLTRIQFEAGAVSLLAGELKLLGVSRPLVVTDKGIVAAGLLATVLAKSGLQPDTAVFDDTPENPTEAAAHGAVELFRTAGCDSIVAIGGGSAIDLGKAVSLLTTHSGPLERYAAILGGVDRISADKPPVIAVPTTAGTGSEVGRAALLTLEDGRKLGFISPHMIPSVAICDPELTLGLPPCLTAATGMDAITHCIETFLSPRFNPVADAIALDGLARAAKWLEIATSNGSDVRARREMMMAALQGGLTFQKGLGAVHSLSHPLGGLKSVKLHHGTLNAVLLPAVLRYNAVGSEEKYARIRAAVGLPEHADVASEMAALSQRLGLPATLGQMGVSADCFEQIAQHAVQDHSTASNPRPVSAQDFRQILEDSL